MELSRSRPEGGDMPAERPGSNGTPKRTAVAAGQGQKDGGVGRNLVSRLTVGNDKWIPDAYIITTLVSH